MKKIGRIFFTAFMAVLFMSVSPVEAKTKAKPYVKPDTVWQVIKKNKELSKYADYVKASGLAKTLNDKKGRYTVFAPSNKAMGSIPKKAEEKIGDSKGAKKQFTKHHIISGSAVFAGNIKGRRASPSTMSGEMIGFDGMGKTLKVNSGTIIKKNQSAKNGVVHIIDKPLVPTSFEEKKADLPETSVERPTPPKAPTMAPAIKEEKKGKSLKEKLKSLFSF